MFTAAEGHAGTWAVPAASEVTLDAFAKSVVAKFAAAPTSTIASEHRHRRRQGGSITSSPAGISCGTDCTESRTRAGTSASR